MIQYLLSDNINISKMQTSKSIILSILESNYSSLERRLVSLPLSFGNLPVDILSKQFTKLNNPHSHRIHYLGPRFANTQNIHKKYAYSQSHPATPAVLDRQIQKYMLDYKKIVTSFSVNQRLKSNHHYKTGLYYRAFEGMNPSLDLAQEFVFDSCFQSGNLDCVIQYKPREFDCFLRIDSNTRGHTQWYFFSIKNGKLMNKIKVNICNISKPQKLYENGMQPYFFSRKSHLIKKKGWAQGHKNIANVKFEAKKYNYSILEDKIPNGTPYCLSFDYQFEHQDDEVFFAYCIPYTYSELIHDISLLPKNICQVKAFAKSLAGIQIPILCIESNKQGKEQGGLEKKNILITGRIHPGETNGSIMLKGFIEFLCSKQAIAVKMRKRINFFIVPMINPDGVIIGNSRSSAAGRDLNRVFLSPDKEIFPQIYQLKYLVGRFLRKRKIFLYFDFHGHSGKKNTFSFGPAYPLSHPNNYKARILPKIIESINNGFRYYSCSFNITESKKSTGRACMFENYGIPFTYTIQSSIGYYYDSQKLKTFAYDKESWNAMGKSICEGTLTYLQGYQEFELFLKERRDVREKKKSERMLISRKTFKNDKNFFDEEPEQPQTKSPLKIKYQTQEGLFMRMLKEMKNLEQDKQRIIIQKQRQKFQEQDVSSDDHDEDQDLQLSKMKELNYLMSQCNNKKQSHCLQFKNESFNNLNKNSGSKKLNIEQENEEQFRLFEEDISRKIKSSNGSRRPRFSPDKIRSETSTMARNIIKTKECDEEKFQNLNISHSKINSSLRNSFRQKSIYNNNKTFHVISKHYENTAQVSQLQFPQSSQENKKPSLNKNEMYQRVRRIRYSSKQQKIKPVVLSGNQFEQCLQQKEVKRKNIQFKIQDLMTGLETRSKMLSNNNASLQKQKSRQKSNLNFPSSFHGMKNQIKQKRNQFKIRSDNKRVSISHMPFEVKKYFNQ